MGRNDDSAQAEGGCHIADSCEGGVVMVSIQKSYLGMYSEATGLKDNLILPLMLLIS